MLRFSIQQIDLAINHHFPPFWPGHMTQVKVARMKSKTLFSTASKGKESSPGLSLSTWLTYLSDHITSKKWPFNEKEASGPWGTVHLEKARTPRMYGDILLLEMITLTQKAHPRGPSVARGLGSD